MRHPIAIVVVLLLAACGPDTAASDDASSGRSSPSPAPPAAVDSSAATSSGASDVLVESDLAYFESDSGDEAHLDVYHPEVGEDLPLVVVFHANPVFGGTKASVAALAKMIAERGAVVVAPTYGRSGSLGDMGLIARDAVTWFRDQGPCAVWTAVDLAPSFGADPSELILVGDVTGVAPAQMATFSPPSEVSGCVASPSDAPIDKAILFEADWFMVPDIWDEVLADDPEYFATGTHWDDLTDPGPTSIRILVGEDGAANTRRSLGADTYLESDWVRLRDPEGALADAFASSGTLDDNDMSFTDVMRVATDVLVDAGWDAEFMVVPGVGHSLSTDESKALVAELVFEGP